MTPIVRANSTVNSRADGHHLQFGIPTLTPPEMARLPVHDEKSSEQSHSPPPETEPVMRAPQGPGQSGMSGVEQVIAPLQAIGYPMLTSQGNMASLFFLSLAADCSNISRLTQAGRGFAKTGTRFRVLELWYFSCHYTTPRYYAVLLSLVIKPSPQSIRTTGTRVQGAG